MTEVPSAVQRTIDATNAGDSEAFVAAFTPDAVLVSGGGFNGTSGFRFELADDLISRMEIQP